MRTFALVALLIVVLSLSARAADAIAVGMQLPEAEAMLHKFGYKTGPQFAMQITAEEQNALEFCRIDENITLAIGYGRSNKKVTSLELFFCPTNPRSKQDKFSREVIEIRLEAGGVYVPKLRRKG